MSFVSSTEVVSTLLVIIRLLKGFTRVMLVGATVEESFLMSSTLTCFADFIDFMLLDIDRLMNF